MDLSYILNELGEDRENYYNAMTPPIMQTSNFKSNTVEDLRKGLANEFGNFLYSRGQNPTVQILRKKMAALDAAEDCLVFNSGAAAIFAAVIAHVKSGDHIVSVEKPYSWAQKIFDIILPKFGVSTTYIDGRYIENFERAILPNTTLIYLESPNSWTFALQDLAAVAELAKAEGIVTLCDNSYCSPFYQKPIQLGIDLCLQSATKYISGHSDTVAGILTGSAAAIKHIFSTEYLGIGSGVQPFNAWLLLRGLRTLSLRLTYCSKSTQQVYEFLKQHDQVEEVTFPGAKDFPQAELVKKQMNGACGLLSFVLKSNAVEDIERFCNKLKHIIMAVSWGGFESLIIPACATMPRAHFNASDKAHRLIRLYVGMEEPEYIINDLNQALSLPS